MNNGYKYENNCLMRAQQDKSSIIEVPELGGCMDDGRTYAPTAVVRRRWPLTIGSCMPSGRMCQPGWKMARHSIYDIARILLMAPGVPLPENFDGRALPPPYRAAVIA